LQAIALGGPVGGPAVSIASGRATLGAGHAPDGDADIWLVGYDPRTILVAIRAGENGGRAVPHRDVVRSLVRIGRWTGAAQSLALPAGEISGLRMAILVQAGRGGPILAAAKG
jgi:hypothetical protein